MSKLEKWIFQKSLKQTKIQYQLCFNNSNSPQFLCIKTKKHLMKSEIEWFKTLVCFLLLFFLFELDCCM